VIIMSDTDTRRSLSVVEHADAAAEAIRAINHLTLWGGLAYPAEAYQLLGDLATLAYRLPHTLAQLARQLDDWHTAGRVRIDPGTEFADNPALAIATATSYLRDDAVPTAERLAAALNQAQQSLAFASYTDATAGGEVDA